MRGKINSYAVKSEGGKASEMIAKEGGGGVDSEKLQLIGVMALISLSHNSGCEQTHLSFVSSSAPALIALLPLCHPPLSLFGTRGGRL